MQATALHTCPRGHTMYGPHGECSACAAWDAPYGQVLAVLLDAFGAFDDENPLNPKDRPSSPGAPVEGEWLTRVVLAEDGLFRDLALKALAQPGAPAVARVVSPGAHAAVLWLRGSQLGSTERVRLDGTDAIERWVDECPHRAAEVAAAHLERVAWEEWSYEGSDAEMWPAFLAAAAAFGGEHPTSLISTPWPFRDGLRACLRGGDWASSGYSADIRRSPLDATPDWDGVTRDSLEEPPTSIEYGQGRSFARLEMLDGMRSRLVCGLFDGVLPVDDPDAEPWNRDAARHEIADAWRSVESRVHFAVRVLRPPLAGLL